MTPQQPIPPADVLVDGDWRGTYVVTVRDDVDARIAGHDGVAYVSPPQPRADALALIALLLGGPASAGGHARWTHAVAGGRRTITLTHHDAQA
jgi:hypothetical protein